ncbi:MAG: prepilin-type N-terminal cleavage/methylation domain-containing protein [Candidatus Tectomicrobia bacterium]|nr:prepilin-type N-terminal cleavage/methylation domain-containing protein [Candidatus Tectomicrobia bacterium]
MIQRYQDENRGKTISKGSAGFTLVELLVAMAILSIGLLTVVQVQAAAARSNLNARRVAAASALTQEKIEELINLPTLAVTQGFVNDTGNPLKADGTPGGIYSRSWKITDAPGMKELEVKVTWTGGASRTVTLKTTVVR